MYECEAVVVVAVAALSRLRDAASIYLHGGGQRTHHALEERLTHLWHHIRCARHHPTHGDQLVYVCDGNMISEVTVWN